MVIDLKFNTWALTASLLLCIVACIGHSLYQRRYRAPGPPRLPLLGNILQHPTQLHFIQYTKWAKEYGPIFSLDLLGQHVVVVNTYKAAADIFDRDSSTYNDRPRMIMLNEILGGGVFLPALKYGNVWRRLRRAIHEGFNARVIGNYQHIQSNAIALATMRIMADPKCWVRDLEWFAASAIFSTLYDWPPLKPEAPVIKQMLNFIARATNAGTPGNFFVEFFPVMKFLPSCVAKWKREGLAWNETQSRMLEGCAVGVSEKLTRGEAPRGFVANLLSREDRLSRKELTWLPGIVATGAIETTVAVISNCIIGMLHFPDVMRKAHAELDKVVGRERPPNFEDRNNLPYLGAIVRETLRWRPVAPLGLPHAASEGKWYAGYYIPKGSIVLGNIWAMSRDPSVHHDPDVYRPERFLDASGKVEVTPPDTHNIGHTTFGFGRRICAGMHFAEQGLWIAITTLLWAFELRAPIDDQGNPVLPPLDEWVDCGVVTRAPPFECRFIPRFAEAHALLQASADTT